jgi:predicted dehydrogenase
MPDLAEDVRNLRWGILGTAGIARSAFVPGVRAVGAGVVEAVASRDADKARAFADDLGIPRAFGSYEEMLASGAVDLVYNPLPNTMHAGWTVRALQAGLPVLCEKPLAMHASEGRAIADAARQAGLPVAEAFMYRFHPLFDAVRAAIARGDVGRVTALRSTFTFALDDLSSLPAAEALGGGALRDVGCYCVNAFRLLAGSEPTRAWAAEHREGVDRTMLGLLEFPGGVLAHFECSIESHERHELTVHGTAGSLSIPEPWLPREAPGRYVLDRDAGRSEVEVPAADAYGLEALDFARAVARGTPPRWPLHDSIANLSVLDALFEAARTGRGVRVAPA